MAAPATKAIIFDCFGVLYMDSTSLFSRYELNIELINLISRKLKPHYKVGLLSNIDRRWIDSFISKHRLENLFDAVIVSGDEGIGKPHAYIYNRMSEDLGVTAKQCLMIDDLRVNCEGAEKAGMQSLLFTSNDSLLIDFRKLRIIP